MKYCSSCGQPCEDAQKFCNNCGAPFPAEQALDPAEPAPVSAPQYVSPAPRATTKKEFLALPENEKLRKDLRSTAIICYVCAGITAVLGMAVLQNPYVLIDVVILIVMGLGIHLAQSRACAVILCAYAVINMIYSLATTGRMSGYLVVLAGVYAVIHTFKAEKLWKQYQQQI